MTERAQSPKMLDAMIQATAYVMLAEIACQLADLNTWNMSVPIPDDERLRTIRELREVCALIGDNDWPDDLDLADVVQKHIHVDR
jgi:hypothetical protein